MSGGPPHNVELLIFPQWINWRSESRCYCQTAPSELHRLASLLCWFKSAHVGHILVLNNAGGLKPLFQIASAESSVVWGGGGGTYCPPQSLPHSFEEQPSFIINRHTKRWAPKQYRTDPFMRVLTSAQHFGNHRAPSTATSSFQIPAHEWKMWTTTKDILNFPFLRVLWNRPMLKLLFV